MHERVFSREKGYYDEAPRRATVGKEWSRMTVLLGGGSGRAIMQATVECKIGVGRFRGKYDGRSWGLEKERVCEWDDGEPDWGVWMGGGRWSRQVKAGQARSGQVCRQDRIGKKVVGSESRVCSGPGWLAGMRPVNVASFCAWDFPSQRSTLNRKRREFRSTRLARARVQIAGQLLQQFALPPPGQGTATRTASSGR